MCRRLSPRSRRSPAAQPPKSKSALAMSVMSPAAQSPKSTSPLVMSVMSVMSATSAAAPAPGVSHTPAAVVVERLDGPASPVHPPSLSQLSLAVPPPSLTQISRAGDMTGRVTGGVRISPAAGGRAAAARRPRELQREKDVLPPNHCEHLADEEELQL